MKENKQMLHKLKTCIDDIAKSDGSDLAEFGAAHWCKKFIRQHGPALEALLRERDSLRDLCEAAYYAAGASDWPLPWLDALSDAANGHPLRHEAASLMPFRPDVPLVHGFDPTPARETVTLEWPDGRFLGYVLDTTRYTDTPEVAAALAGPKP